MKSHVQFYLIKQVSLSDSGKALMFNLLDMLLLFVMLFISSKAI